MDGGAIGTLSLRLFCRIRSIATLSCELNAYNGCPHRRTAHLKLSMRASMRSLDFPALL